MSSGPNVCAAANAPGNQRSMLDKFRLINPRSGSRTSPSVAEMALQEEDDLSEYGDDPTPAPAQVPTHTHAPPLSRIGSPVPHPQSPPLGHHASSSLPTAKGSGKGQGSKSLAQPNKGESDGSKAKSGKVGKAGTPPKEERDSSAPGGGDASGKKGSKIASLIPKGGKPAAGGKKDGGSSIPASSGIPKPGLKAPQATAKQTQQSSSMAGGNTSVPGSGTGGSGGGAGPTAPGAVREGSEKAKLAKGGQSSYYVQRSAGGSGEPRRTNMTSSTSTSALSGSTSGIGGGGGGGGGVMGGNGAVQLPQQQQHNHPNTATVAPFMYR